VFRYDFVVVSPERLIISLMAPRLIFIVTSILFTSDSDINKPKSFPLLLSTRNLAHWIIQPLLPIILPCSFKNGVWWKAHNVVYFIIANIAVLSSSKQGWGLYVFSKTSNTSSQIESVRVKTSKSIRNQLLFSSSKFSISSDEILLCRCLLQQPKCQIIKSL
jgi:hypothetical protein